MFFYFLVIASFSWVLASLGTDSYDLETPTWIGVGIAIVLSLWHTLHCVDILNRKVENAGSGNVMLFGVYGVLLGPLGIIVALLTPASYLVPSASRVPSARSAAVGDSALADDGHEGTQQQS